MGDYVFMDMSTFDTMNVPKDVIAEQSIWMTEGVEVTILKFGDKILDVAVPNTMSLEVVDTEPGVKGNTAQGGDKPATLESGAVIRCRSSSRRARRSRSTLSTRS